MLLLLKRFYTSNSCLKAIIPNVFYFYIHYHR
uniref:Uncharacterized protein n=1 Tax=Siphoviridae sp. ctRiO19 TaxID=2826337 RepID=A0A8S5LWW0_9CAUD|nr:MAG TPA: hypothetical protein [Siphoviridae sp. ctRiO19]